LKISVRLEMNKVQSSSWIFFFYTKTPINAKNLSRIKWFLHLLVRLIFVEKTLKYPLELSVPFRVVLFLLNLHFFVNFEKLF
jgi:hypothetical protein